MTKTLVPAGEVRPLLEALDRCGLPEEATRVSSSKRNLIVTTTRQTLRLLNSVEGEAQPDARAFKQELGDVLDAFKTTLNRDSASALAAYGTLQLNLDAAIEWLAEWADLRDGDVCLRCLKYAGNDYHIAGVVEPGENNKVCDECWDERLR